MIIVKLWGGMCNQLFQYAFGFALAKKHNDELVFDIDFYSNQPSYVGKRSVIGESDFHVTKMIFANRPSIIKLFENKYINHLIRYNGGCSFSLPSNHYLVIENYHKYYETIPYKKEKANFYDGYWQTAKYFEEYRQELLTEFSPNPDIDSKIKMWKASMNSDKCVAVHIRRGDYLSSLNQKSLGEGNVIGNLDYYKKAMEIMSKSLNNPTFCFFSDDINWCKENFSGLYPNMVFVENKGKDAAILDLLSISICEHGIMSPSTFSWWGNWLRKDSKNSLVICPKGEIGNEFFICDNWTAI